MSENLPDGRPCLACCYVPFPRKCAKHTPAPGPTAPGPDKRVEWHIPNLDPGQREWPHRPPARAVSDDGWLYERGMGPAMFTVTCAVLFVALLVSLAPDNGEYRHAWPYWPVFWAIEVPGMLLTWWLAPKE